MVATDLLCSFPRMLWFINGWSLANAVSYMSSRRNSLAEGYCRGQGLLQEQRCRCWIGLRQWLLTITNSYCYGQRPEVFANAHNAKVCVHPNAIAKAPLFSD